MHNLLLINPNTSKAMTELLLRHVQAALGTRARLHAATARFGAPYIADEASYAVAAHATLDAWANALTELEVVPDSVLIACFGDPGLMALRDCSPVPVTGLAEASFNEAAQHGRFAVVTGGERWIPMLQRLAQSLGYAASLAGIHAVAPTGAQLAADPVSARKLLSSACRDAVRRFGAQAVILGGAGLAGMAVDLQPELDVPLVDSVGAGAARALRKPEAPPQRRSAGFDVPWVNLSGAMASLGRLPPA